MADREDHTDNPTFKNATIAEVFKTVMEPNTRVGAGALQLSSEYLRLFATEAIHRSAEIKQKQDANKAAGGGGGGLLEVKHLEKVVAGILLDF